MDQILKTMAELGKAEALEMKAEARAEIEKAQVILDELL
jgi:hypothetical protein